MRIRGVKPNNRARAFDVRVPKGVLRFPYARCRPQPTAEDRVETVIVDPELGQEAFTYVLASGREGSVHVDSVLDYNRDPRYMRYQILYRLTVEAQKGVASSPLSKREIIRRLETSAAQFYRLLDTTNYRKSIDQVLELLTILGCRVELVVRAKSA